MVTDRLPCATAQGSSLTSWFITTEPVRALTTTRAAASAGVTSIFCSLATKPTRSDARAGARTLIVRPSAACAVSVPNCLLMAVTMFCTVPKSVVPVSSWMLPASPTVACTARSTVAPLAIRPAPSWLICTLLPLADAPAPPITTLPCANA